ncbi:MAG: hypothetical protein CME18_06960 [Gemmatimonadetes bacterium]|nr:hypothetical protein [Gemmatimonadota bacterium]MEE2863521.1 hypothetical protein [Gemmatimonadota bacterium]|tara:strand:+ start:29630 stop:30037 length:408 start_codon:yes stop_codon:yes gene_type:complete
MDWTKGREGDLGRDVELEEQLRVLDPSQDDPSYWFRFRGWVMKEAEGELARRRMSVDLTVEDLLESWSRTVIPVAMAAAIAAIALIRSSPDDAPELFMAVGVEELLVREIPAQTQPVLLSPNAAEGIVAFAMDTY